MVVGWSIRVFRQAGGGDCAGREDSRKGQALARWRSGVQGADWIDDLVRQGCAVSLGGYGYPYTYTAPARWVAPHALAVQPDDWGPPDPRLPWIDPRPVIDRAGLDACPPDEWLLIEVWDLD